MADGNAGAIPPRAPASPVLIFRVTTREHATRQGVHHALSCSSRFPLSLPLILPRPQFPLDVGTFSSSIRGRDRNYYRACRVSSALSSKPRYTLCDSDAACRGIILINLRHETTTLYDIYIVGERLESTYIFLSSYNICTIE